ncbi:45747_t:CDS:2, partial [Gigaspora margarita]
KLLATIYSKQALLKCLILENPKKEIVEKVVISNLANNEKKNYIAIKDDCSMVILGLFATEDVACLTSNKIKQIVIAIAKKAIATKLIIKYLVNLTR